MSGASFSSIEIAASEWLVTLSDPDASPEDRRRFADWLAADAEHERVFRAQEQAWSMVGGMAHLIDDRRPAVASAPRVALPGKRPWSFAAAAAVALVLLGLLSFHYGLPFLSGRQFSTEVAQLKQVTLDDGSIVSLGAASRMDVDFSSRQRRVTLREGQAFFDVAHDPARPFLVSAGRATVRVVGTQFDVTYGADDVRVSVLQGRVEVLNGGAARIFDAARAEPIQRAAHALTAGQGAVISRSGHLDATFPVAQGNLGAWRSGRLVYVDAHLRDVVADVSRYYGGEIQLADAAVGDLRLTVAFRADQIDRMLEVLARALPIAVERVDDRVMRLSLRDQ